MKNHRGNEVWLIIDSRQFGGIETHVLQLAAGLLTHNQPVKVWLITQYDVPSPLCEKLETLGVPYQYLGSNTCRAIQNLIQFVQTQLPIALHAHGYKANLVAKIAKLITGTKLISTYHAGETPKGRVRLYDWLDRVSAGIANHALTVSRAIGKKVPTQTHYLENFIDVDKLGLSHGENIAFVGRLSAEKAPERFVQLAKQFPKQLFHVYGTGNLAHSLQETATGNVHFHGHQADMSTVWPNISLLMICSHYEGLPMVALEAMSRGIVVISTAVGEMPQLIDHQHNGFIAQNEQQLKECLTLWFSLSANEQQFIRGNALKSIHQHYSQQAIIPKLLSLYEPSNC
ncbi:glycosyltransferase family 4 protein [Vibrio sp. 404]|uniref:Glycosyltransferase family 4 protein n=1 Tax=Vibrio marinisediminis TaxID=2758441 RepID=A0A7W2FSP4_9VIBR|nr:glycosyltransferase family 4 protein [Vibrio marinisediminis]MBA5763541.1 glycosyltransferase family 4 protein [Vibrio marinisediminis]